MSSKRHFVNILVVRHDQQLDKTGGQRGKHRNATKHADARIYSKDEKSLLFSDGTMATVFDLIA